jgi:two-component system catabolic regulation response regulator CreB/two-component system response regulator ChvI
MTIGKKTTNNTPPYKILFVDDEEDITMSIKSGLQDTRLFAVDTYNDPQIALSDFKPAFYDLYLIDVKMPQMNGFELYQKLKDMEDDKQDVKVCFITAYEIYYEILKNEFPGLNIGCFISKPIEIHDLVKRLKQELLSSSEKS